MVVTAEVVYKKLTIHQKCRESAQYVSQQRSSDSNTYFVAIDQNNTMPKYEKWSHILSADHLQKQFHFTVYVSTRIPQHVEICMQYTVFLNSFVIVQHINRTFQLLQVMWFIVCAAQCQDTSKWCSTTCCCSWNYLKYIEWIYF